MQPLPTIGLPFDGIRLARRKNVAWQISISRCSVICILSYSNIPGLENPTCLLYVGKKEKKKKTARSGPHPNGIDALGIKKKEKNLSVKDSCCPPVPTSEIAGSLDEQMETARGSQRSLLPIPHERCHAHFDTVSMVKKKNKLVIHHMIRERWLARS
jgi:hypothetical protein